MAGTVRVVVHSRVPAVAAAVHAKAALITAKAAHDIEAQAKQRAPVDTGLLRNSIRAHGQGLTWIVESPVDYSVFQEFGTSRMAAQPYMVPALEMVAPSYAAAMKALI